MNHIRLPLTFGAPGATIHTGGFSISVLGYQPITHEVRLRVRRGSSSSPEVELNWNVGTLSSQRVESGETTWVRGEALCLNGTWSYDKMAISQEAVIDATYPLGGPGMTAAWLIEGVSLPPTSTPSSGSVNVTMSVRVPNPKFNEVIETRTIKLAYTIEPLPNGSRLKLRNRPQDESFKSKIEVVLSNSFGSGSAITWINFKGHEYVYEPGFYEARDACYKQFIDVGKRFRPFRVVPFPQLWEQLDQFQEVRVYDWLEALAEHLEGGDRQLFDQGTRALAQELSVPDLALQILSVEEAFSPPQIEGEIPPPLSPDFTGIERSG